MTQTQQRRPAVGVGGVVWKDNKVLLIQRGKDPGKGNWSLPGGHQEWGETVRQAVAREVMEETGLAVAVGPLIDVVDAIFPDGASDPAHHFTLIDFRCEWISGEAVAGDDAAAVRWCDLLELNGIDLWEQTRRVIELSIKVEI